MRPWHFFNKGLSVTDQAWPMVRISGREYPERPKSSVRSGGRVRRMRLIAEALAYASGACGEEERRLYKSILEVRAHAENLLAQLEGERLPEPLLSDLKSAAYAP